MDNIEKEMMKLSDEELMELVKNRNTSALSVLYERYSKRMYYFIYRYTNNREIAEDILQETFTRVWYAAHTFNSAKGSFKTWLYTIGINITRNEMIKKRYSYKHIKFDDLTGDVDSNSSIETEPVENFLEQAEIKDVVTKALEQLNPFLKEIVILKHFEKLKFSEIALMTNTPEGTLKARFYNALVQLKKHLAKVEF